MSKYFTCCISGYRPTRYLANETEYPANETGFSANETGYPSNRTVYPANKTVYPANKTVYPANETVYPANEIGFPAKKQISIYSSLNIYLLNCLGIHFLIDQYIHCSSIYMFFFNSLINSLVVLRW